MTQELTAVDKVAMAVSGGLMLLGIVVLGIIEVVAGAPYGPLPLTNDAGTVVATPLFGPNIRTGLVILGLLVMLLWGLYKVTAPEPAGERVPTAESHAD